MGVSGNQRRDIVFSASNVYTQLTNTISNSTAYVELTAATTVPIYITHVTRASAPNGSSNNCNVIVATGAAASEVVVFTGYSVGSNTSEVPGPTIFALPFPIRIPASTRLSCKVSVAANETSTVGVIYVNESAVA